MVLSIKIPVISKMKHYIILIFGLLFIKSAVLAQTDYSKKERNRILKEFAELEQNQVVLADSLINDFFQVQLSIVGMDTLLIYDVIKKLNIDIPITPVPHDIEMKNYELIFVSGDTLNSELLKPESKFENHVSYWKFIELQTAAGKTGRIPYDMIDKTIFNFKYSIIPDQSCNVSYLIKPIKGQFELIERVIE